MSVVPYYSVGAAIAACVASSGWWGLTPPAHNEAPVAGPPRAGAPDGGAEAPALPPKRNSSQALKSGRRDLAGLLKAKPRRRTTCLWGDQDDTCESTMLATIGRLLIDAFVWMAFSSCWRWWAQRQGCKNASFAPVSHAEAFASTGEVRGVGCVADPAPGDDGASLQPASPADPAALAGAVPALQLQKLPRACSVEEEASAKPERADENGQMPQLVRGEGDEFTKTREMLGQKWLTDTRHETAIFEDEQIELQYHRRRSLVLPCFVRAFERALGDNHRMWDEGQCLIKDNDELMDALRRMEQELVQAEGDAEYWRTLAEAGGPDEAARHPPSPTPPPSEEVSLIEDSADLPPAAATPSPPCNEDNVVARPAADGATTSEARRFSNGGGSPAPCTTAQLPPHPPGFTGRRSSGDVARRSDGDAGAEAAASLKGGSPCSERSSVRSPDLILMASPKLKVSTPDRSPFSGGSPYRRLPEGASACADAQVPDPSRQELLRSPRCVVDCGTDINQPPTVVDCGVDSNTSPTVVDCGGSKIKSPTMMDSGSSNCKSPTVLDSGRPNSRSPTGPSGSAANSKSPGAASSSRSSSKSPKESLAQLWEQQRLLVQQRRLQQQQQKQQQSQQAQQVSPHKQCPSPPHSQPSPQIQQRFNWSPEHVNEARKLHAGSPRALLAYLPLAEGSLPDIAG